MARTPRDFLVELDIPCEAGAPLGPHTWYGVGGRAAVLARPRDESQLALLVKACHERQTPVYVLGSGANLLVRDAGVDGVVVKLDAEAFSRCTIDGPAVTVGSGYDLMKLVLETAKAGLSGLEAAAGIPATVGGAVRMNAGGAFGDVGQSVARVRVMTEAGEAVTLQHDDLSFGYRHASIDAPFILDATFELEPGDAGEIMQRVKEIFAYKKASQPMGANSAGCAFRNPAGDAAGRLIDAAGLKGFTIGSAQVSPVHANFITVDKAGGRADDVVAVMEHIESAVKDRFGVALQREVVVWP